MNLYLQNNKQTRNTADEGTKGAAEIYGWTEARLVGVGHDTIFPVVPSGYVERAPKSRTQGSFRLSPPSTEWPPLPVSDPRP